MPPMFIEQRLANGLRIFIEMMPHVQSAACGFFARTGARDDPRELAGVSHYLEHMCFKGTAGRTWEEINRELDELGSQYNAYTSKDRTFYYGWVRAEHLERQLELLADMMRPSLPTDEFEMEKGVILEEIAMSGDDLASNAYDFLYETMCAGSTVEWPVLGYESTIQPMTRDGMQAYFRRRYAPENLVLVVAGNVSPERVFAAAERVCGGWEPCADPDGRRQAPTLCSTVATRQIERFRQQAVLLGFPSVSATHPLDETAEAVAAILGGTNSRIYWNIVQKGLSTRAGAFREEYGDFGLLVLFALCEPENCEKVVEALRAEAAGLERGVEAREIRRVKNLRRTSLATESEAPFYRLGQLVDDIDYLGAPRTVEERMAAVEAVSEDTVAAYLRGCPITTGGCLVSLGPRAWPGLTSPRPTGDRV